MAGIEKPMAGILWSGSGEINSNPLNSEKKEFFVPPQTAISIFNSGDDKMIIYSVFPFKK
jgi:hypothetical protein